jgi:hypothetical protein
MIQSLLDDELKYTLIEKHTFSLVKYIGKFRHFILGKKMQVRVPFPAMTYFLTQTHISRKISHWLAKIHEHDLMITTTKTIKGHDLSLHLAQHPETSDSVEEDENDLSTLFFLKTLDINLDYHPWYKDMIYYIFHHNFPIRLDSHHRRILCLISSKYLILGSILYRRFVDGILLRCVDDNIAQIFLNELHGSTDSNLHICGHFSKKDTSLRIIRAGYFWPLMFQDYFKFVWACENCQKFSGREHVSTIHLQSIFPNFPLA